MTTVMCQNCNEHEGTLDWVGEGGLLAFTHGFSQKWCECCVLKVQLEYARKLSANIPNLESQLAKACQEQAEEEIKP